jgi:hypothetical protein
LKEETQTFWDTWHKLRQGPGEDISEYNSAFEQALTDLSREITDEQVKIEKYKSGLQTDLRELACVSPSGKRWTSLIDLISFCTLQWPTIKARREKKGKFAKQAAEKTAGKRKNMSPNRRGKGNSGNGSGQSSARMSDKERARHIREKLCMICHKPGHISPKCPDRTTPWVNRGGKKHKNNNNSQKDFS